MQDHVIPEEIQHFILENVESIAQLEALLLFRANPDISLGVSDISQRLYISSSDSQELVLHLLQKGFLKEVDGKSAYLYAPPPETVETIDRVAEFYARRLVALTNFIHSKRKSKVQKFADAFRIRKD